LRPKSVSEWVERRTQTPRKGDGGPERRQVEIGVGSQILTDLGVRDMVLLSNSPAHVYVGLEGFGLRIVGSRRIE
jgi:3,4-dihydroxy 2-butanone 4-phosphate synthase/GTP cyclohydrolase II